MNSLSDYRPVGLSTCRINDLSDHRPVELPAYLINDLSDCRPVGLSNCRTIDLLDYPADYRAESEVHFDLSLRMSLLACCGHIWRCKFCRWSLDSHHTSLMTSDLIRKTTMSRRSSTRPSTACNYKTTAWSGYLLTLHSLYHGLFLLGKSTGEQRMWVWMTSTSDSGREISFYVSWTDTRRPQSHDNKNIWVRILVQGTIYRRLLHDCSRWSSRPIRSLRYIATYTRIRVLAFGRMR